MKTHSDTDQVIIPLRPRTAAGQTASKDDAIQLLRRFYLGNSEMSSPEESVRGQYLPAFLGPYRDGSALRHDYPLFLASLTDIPSSDSVSWPLAAWPPTFPREDSVDEPDSPFPDSSAPDPSESELRHRQNNIGDIGVFPLPGLFKNLMADIPTEVNQRRLLEENLVRLEKHVIEIIDRGDEAPKDANTVLDQAVFALQDSLRLGEKQREQLKVELKRLMERMPTGYFLPFGRGVPLHILAHMAKLRFKSQREKTLHQIKKLTTGLNALLEIEKSKSIESIEPKMVRDSIGPGGNRFMDPLVLSNLMDHSRGSQSMPAEQLERIRETLRVLENEQIIHNSSPQLTLVRHGASHGVCGLPEGELTPELAEQWDLRESPNPFATALAIFNEQTVMLIRLARAMRIASLDLANAYDPKIHDPWFANFDWYALSEEESKLAPVVLVIDSGTNVTGSELAGLSRLLRADRPVQILLEVQPGTDPGMETEDVMPNDSRMELGYFGISHRRAVIAQSSATRPLHLLEGFSMALQRQQPSLHLLGVGHQARGALEQPLSPWLMDSAAVEGRAHPLFRYDPAVGGKWWVPLSLIDNPQSGADWPTHPFQYRTEDGAVTEIRMTFGFVDYALLDPRWWQHFHPVPDTLDAEEIVHLDDYLALEPQQMETCLPFLWAVYDDQRTRGIKLRRLIVSRTLVLACLDRREFWRMLQTLSGVHNHHVDIAVARVSADAKDKSEKQQALLIAEHSAELARVQREAGTEALRRLTESLLTMDLSTIPVTPNTGAGATAPPPSLAETPDEQQDTPSGQPDIAPPSEPESIPQPDLESGDEPWIDTPLCTTCNECTDLNPRLFVYNEDKQAEIGDLTAGTHAELVEAAEICPAKCIHPGTPG
uniref:4Fe-4S single cluster domain of Ferredoxin I n=1 Tax=Candidatus Kentrum sp. FW TaxID=2126338 RepID=A0A450U0D2_9GAMM|nr:MAG: 4Fe-4S single cluster domain of Ferredoxin I [Candidatus Kentron sp. FW]